jgi:hypothetical protein
MEISRNQYFLIGLVLGLLGLQVHLIDTFELTAECTQLLAERTGRPSAAIAANVQALIPTDKPVVKKTIHPPEWLGWSLMSIGAVLILHSCAMKKPGG